jgi:hypothetical protein
MRLEKVNLGPFKVDYDEWMALRRRKLKLVGCVVIEQKPEEPKPDKLRKNIAKMMAAEGSDSDQGGASDEESHGLEEPAAGDTLNLKEKGLMMTCFDRWRAVKDATAESKVVVSGQDYLNWLTGMVQRVESEHFTTRRVELEWRMPDGRKNECIVQERLPSRFATLRLHLDSSPRSGVIGLRTLIA